jgi:hypothetical protein
MTQCPAWSKIPPSLTRLSLLHDPYISGVNLPCVSKRDESRFKYEHLEIQFYAVKIRHSPIEVVLGGVGSTAHKVLLRDGVSPAFMCDQYIQCTADQFSPGLVKVDNTNA